MNVNRRRLLYRSALMLASAKASVSPMFFGSSIAQEGVATPETRCDTHPRASVDGHTIAIDSPHSLGRQVYLLDIRELLASLA